MSKPLGPNFEDNITIIDAEINKRRNLWTLSSIQWMDFDDVAQIIRIHLHEKWSLYNQDKPLVPWLNKVISHQIKNIITANESEGVESVILQPGGVGCVGVFSQPTDVKQTTASRPNAAKASRA